ncbi:MAG: helix-turn-helix transcriptional regulator, partial [bacterium]|nr:helix-turn-helix transcriptional regulator [bacterium]
MAKLSIKNQNYYTRAIFPRGKQKDFLEKIQIRLDLTLKELAELTGICVRSLTDWKREKFSMSLPALKRLCQEARIPLP